MRWFMSMEKKLANECLGKWSDMMFDKNGNAINGWAILKCESDNQPEIVSLHQCLGNAEEEKMF